MIIALVGLPGSGKGTAAKILEKHGFQIVRFGEVTDKELKKMGLEINEKNEREIRERIRKELGMGAYAIMNAPLIDEKLKKSNVVVDGLRSFEEYKILKERFGEKLKTVAIISSQEKRIERLKNRKVRPLAEEELKDRDKNELITLNVGETLARADYKIVNESSIKDLENKIKKVVEKI